MKIVKASLLTVLALGPVTNIGMAGEIEAVAQRLRRITSLDDG